MPEFIPVEYDPFDLSASSQRAYNPLDYIEPPPKGGAPPVGDWSARPAPQAAPPPEGIVPFYDPAGFAPPQGGGLPNLGKLMGMPSALEQSGAIDAAHPWQPGMTGATHLIPVEHDPFAPEAGR